MLEQLRKSDEDLNSSLEKWINEVNVKRQIFEHRFFGIENENVDKFIVDFKLKIKEEKEKVMSEFKRRTEK